MAELIPEHLKCFRHPQSNQDVSFSSVRGKIITEKVWSESNVYTTRVGQGVAVKTDVLTRREIWVRGDSGAEFMLNGGDNVKVNQGNDVTIVYSGSETSRTPLLLINHSTGMWHGFGWLEVIYTNLYFRRHRSSWFSTVSGVVYFLAFLFAFPLGFVLIAEGDGPLGKILVPAFCLLIGFLVFGFVKAFRKGGAEDRRKKSAASEFERHSREIAQALQ